MPMGGQYVKNSSTERGGADDIGGGEPLLAGSGQFLNALGFGRN